MKKKLPKCKNTSWKKNNYLLVSRILETLEIIVSIKFHVQTQVKKGDKTQVKKRDVTQMKKRD